MSPLNLLLFPSHWNLIYSWGIAAPTKGQVSTPTTLHQQADTPVHNTPSHQITRESLYSRGIPSHTHIAWTQNGACDGKPNQFWQCWWRHQVRNIICIFTSIFCFLFFFHRWSGAFKVTANPFPAHTYQVTYKSLLAVTHEWAPCFIVWFIAQTQRYDVHIFKFLGERMRDTVAVAFSPLSL